MAACRPLKTSLKGTPLQNSQQTGGLELLDLAFCWVHKDSDAVAVAPRWLHCVGVRGSGEVHGLLSRTWQDKTTPGDTCASTLRDVCSVEAETQLSTRLSFPGHACI